MSTLFEAGVCTARAALNRVSGALNQVEFFLSMGKPEDAYHMAFNYARQVEKLLLHARILPAYTYHPEAMDLMQKQIVDVMPIEIGFTAEGWFFIRIPALLPKKEKGNADYIRSSLWYALKAYTEEHPIYSYGSCSTRFSFSDTCRLHRWNQPFLPVRLLLRCAILMLRVAPLRYSDRTQVPKHW